MGSWLVPGLARGRGGRARILFRSSELQPAPKATQGVILLTKSCFLEPQRQAKSVTAQSMSLAAVWKQLMAHWGNCRTRSGSDSEVSVAFCAAAAATHRDSRAVRNCMVLAWAAQDGLRQG